MEINNILTTINNLYKKNTTYDVNLLYNDNFLNRYNEKEYELIIKKNNIVDTNQSGGKLYNDKKIQENNKEYFDKFNEQENIFLKKLYHLYQDNIINHPKLLKHLLNYVFTKYFFNNINFIYISDSNTRLITKLNKHTTYESYINSLPNNKTYNELFLGIKISYNYLLKNINNIIITIKHIIENIINEEGNIIIQIPLIFFNVEFRLLLEYFCNMFSDVIIHYPLLYGKLHIAGFIILKNKIQNGKIPYNIHKKISIFYKNINEFAINEVVFIKNIINISKYEKDLFYIINNKLLAKMYSLFI